MSFKSHKLNDTGFRELKKLKTAIVALKKLYEEVSGEGRDLAIAITKLEESSFWATKAMASKPENHSEVTEY